MQQVGQLSPDLQTYWDGQRWAPALSADGQWRWDGTQWVSAAAQAMVPAAGAQLGAAPPPAPAGVPAYGTPVLVYRPPTNGLATVSLVTGLISWFVCPLIGGVVAIITGHIARGQIKQTGESGGGLAIAGLILGYIQVVALAVIVLFWIVVFGGLAILGAVLSVTPSPSP